MSIKPIDVSEYQSREALEFRALLPRFVVWLEQAGVLVQEPTSEWEALRFRAAPAHACLGRAFNKTDLTIKPKSHVVYRNKMGTVRWGGDSRTYWSWFRSGQPCPLQGEITVAKKSKSWTQRRREDIIERDGTNCYFCGKTMLGHDHTGRPTANGKDDMTIEHLIAQRVGRETGVDVNHIENLVLAHALCNRQIGHRPIAEKITYREIMHDQRTTMWDHPEIATPRERTR